LREIQNKKLHALSKLKTKKVTAYSFIPLNIMYFTVNPHLNLVPKYLKETFISLCVERDQKHIIFIRYYTLKSKNSELRSSPFVPLPKFWCINVQLMSPILEICSFISFILFKAIVIDISILFRKW